MQFETWLMFSGAAMALSLAPGPNNLLAMFTGARHGVGAAAIGGLGRLVAFAVMISITAMGLGVVLAASEGAFTVIKWGGAAYLVYLGIKTWRSHVAGDHAQHNVPVGTLPDMIARPTSPALMRAEFLTAAGNPKAILIFTAFFPQFLDPAASYGPQFAIMGGTFIAMEGLVLLAYGLIGGQVRGLVRSVRHMRLLNRISGGVLVGAGILLTFTRQASAAS